MSSKPIDYQIVGNFKFPIHFKRECIEYALRYEPKECDKFIVTYPKSGTTWTQQIMNLIDNLVNNNKEGQSKTFMRDSFLEFSGQYMKSYPAIKTHIPFELLHLNSSAKYLLVFRNPKDSCVSFYYHLLKTNPESQGTFHDFFERWFRGDAPYGDYFENCLTYWKNRFDDNFQFLVYEQMKENPREAVLSIARFMEKDIIRELENNEQLIEEVLKKSSFDSMKNDLNVYNFFVRKGIVGDWKNHFNKEESDLVDHKIRSVFRGTTLDTLWDSYIEWSE